MLLDCFPADYQPSKSQAKLISEVDKALTNYKFIIVSAPTGTGKSFLPITLSSYSGKPSKEFENLIKSYDAFQVDYSGNYVFEKACLEQDPFGTFALTITKSLQNQYNSLFAKTPLLKGKMNYMCSIDENYDVEMAPCLFAPRIKQQCWKNNICPYYNSRNIAILSQFAVLNYKMFLSLPGHVKRKNFIVCDEASELENELVKQYSLMIDYEQLKKHNIEIKPLLIESKKYAYIWLSDLMLKIDERFNKIINRQSTKMPNPGINERRNLLYLKTVFNSVQTLLNLWSSNDWVITRSNTGAHIIPLKVNKLSSNIFRYGNQTILMSATIIDHKNFARSLGITDYCYIESPSRFDSKKSPIFTTSKNKLNHFNIKRSLPDIVKNIESICNMHSAEKGIIHTHSNDITLQLKTYLTSNRFLFRTDYKNNEFLLNEHYNRLDPTVLVSPSLTHGVDLRDDLARFCIIVKMPYLPLGDKRIKTLFNRDKDWYENNMLNILVQMCGRTTRSKLDYSSTYILDGNAQNVLIRCKNKLPQYFVDRVL